MLIVPVSRSPDWRKPPVVLLLLILLNIVVFFGLQGRDGERLARAFEYYRTSTLPAIEVPRHLAHLEAGGQKDLIATLKSRQEAAQWWPIIAAMESDPDFMRRLRAGEIVQPSEDIYPRWARERGGYERLRQAVTLERLGFKPGAPTFAGLIGHMLLHGDLMHLLGNMAILFVVGYLVEEALGKRRFLLFYLLAGLGAAALDFAVNPQSLVPRLGASGAVSGVMAMFVMLYGIQRIRFFYWVFVYFDFFRAPAIIMLPVWMVSELGQHLFNDGSRINYLAHLGDFITGALLVAAQRRFGRAKVSAPSQEAPSDPLSPERARLEAQFNALRFDEALKTARRCVALAPLDQDLLQRYYTLARMHPTGEDIHRAATLIFALPDEGEVSALIHRTFADYLKTARPSVRLASTQLIGLIRCFARHGFLDDAERLTVALARRKAGHPNLPALLLLVAESFRRAGNRPRQRALIERLRADHPGSEEARQANSL